MTFYSNPKRDYVLNPRGKALYDDSNRFGTKMLEKMGWSKGKGLGANLDGQLEFIKVSHKGDQKGVGFKDRDDQWTTHESNFNSLLTSFQSANNSDEEPKDCAVQLFQSDEKPAKRKKEKVYEKEELFSGVSLEERSKNSRARVHYKKFTRGKDLARYSEKDLANIFGKKSLNNAEADGSSEENDKTEKMDKSSENTPNFGITTIETGTTINDYFKNKMKKVANGFKETSDEQVSNVESVSSSKKEKKNRKSKSKTVDDSLAGDNEPKVGEKSDVEVVLPEQSSVGELEKRTIDNINETKSKKKKKLVENLIDGALVEETLPSSKKRKKNKSEKVCESTKSEDIQTEKPKKRKNEAKIDSDSGTVIEISKKSKETIGYNDNESQSTKKSETVSEIISYNHNNENASEHKKSKRKRENKPNESSDVIPAAHQKSTNLFEVVANAADEQISPIVLTDNVYKIRRYRTEIFRYVDLHAFPGSTLCDIPGYGYTSEMTLNIIDKQDDSKLINTLWNDAYDKYVDGKKKKKKFVEHMVDLKKKNVFKI